MRHTLPRALLLLLMLAPTVTATAQDKKPESQSAAKDKPATKPAPVVTIAGCVQGTGSVGDPFTLLDPQQGLAYRLTGTNMRAYIGKRVQIAGGPDSRRLKIVGGLTPSANVAGQAGAMDPARAAVESTPLSTTGKSDQQLPEFRVRSVRPVAGACGK